MIRKSITFLLTLAVAVSASAREKVAFMLQWSPQAQFAGYYVAMDKGFYDDENLDVEIKHPTQSTRKSALDYLRAGEVDIITAQLITALMAKDQGVDVNNILQTSQQSSLCCIARKPLKSLSDLDSLSVVRLKVGYSELSLMMEREQSLNIDWVQMLNSLNSFLFGAADAILAMSYGEYNQLRLSIGEISEENVIRFADHGYNFPEDGVYVLDDFCRSHPSAVAAFKRASIKGWQYAAEHPGEALSIVIRYMKEANVATSPVHQEMMLQEILKLQLDGNGRRTFAPLPKESYIELVTRACAAGLLESSPAYNKFFLQ